MITSEKRIMSFGHNTGTLDASFLSYSNGRTTEERYKLKVPHQHPTQINTKNKIEDDEIGIFGAERYFKGDIDEELLRTPSKQAARYHSSQPQEEREQPYPARSPKTPNATPSVRSESSWNSRRGLLVRSSDEHGRKTRVKSLLASLGCNCNDKASVKTTDNRVHVKEVKKQPVKAGDLPKKSEPNETKVKRKDGFTFPVLSSSMADQEHRELQEIKHEGEITHVRTRRDSSEGFGSPVLENRKRSLSLERKLTMLNWDGVAPRAEISDISRNGGHNDTGSDTSSDLFEIESFSTNENNSVLVRKILEKSDGRPSSVNGYAPSEASVDWSVVTASAADFSTVDDKAVSQRVKAAGDMERVKGSGILSGCRSLKAVRVSGNEHRTSGGGEKLEPTMVGPTMREWCHRLDSATPVAQIQAETKLIGAGFDPHRGQKGFGTARSSLRMHSPRASHQCQ